MSTYGDIPHEIAVTVSNVSFCNTVCFACKTTQINTHSIRLSDSLSLSRQIQVNCKGKLVTITIFYSTGTILVQGNKCPRWRDEEFNSLILCIRAIYTFVDRVKEPGLHETVTWNLCSLRLPTVSPWPAGEPRLHDVRPRCSPRPLLPRTTGNTRSSRRLQALSPKSASPSAAPVPVSQPNILTRQLVPSRTTPPTTPLQQAYPQSHRHHTPPASLPSHTATSPRQQAYPVTPPPPHPASL